MRAKQLNDSPAIYLLLFDVDDDPIAGLEAFAAQASLKAASFTGLGAFSSAKLAFYRPETKEYEYFDVSEQVEVLALVGNIARKNNKPKIHPHVTLGRRDGSALGGHLVSARVKPTLEVTIIEAAGSLRRRLDTVSQLDLIDPDDGFTPIQIPPAAKEK